MINKPAQTSNTSTELGMLLRVQDALRLGFLGLGHFNLFKHMLVLLHVEHDLFLWHLRNLATLEPKTANVPSSQIKLFAHCCHDSVESLFSTTDDTIDMHTEHSMDLSTLSKNKCLGGLEPKFLGRGVGWAAQDVAQLRQWLEECRKPREMLAMRSDLSLESIKTKIKQLHRGAPDQPSPLKRRRTTEVLAEIETAMTETPWQTLNVLPRHSSLDMSRSMLWRAQHEDLQAQCFKPVRSPRLTAENRLARLNFCRDLLQRVERALGPWQTALKAMDLTRVVFSDEKFFRWNYTGPAQNNQIWGGWNPQETCTKDRSRSRHVHQRAQPAQPRHHGGRRDGERYRFPVMLHRRGCAHQHRMLHSHVGRRGLATLHGAPWHRHVKLVVAERQRPITHQPAYQGVFEGARNNPAPHVASVLARLEPTRFSPLARVGNGSSSPSLSCAPQLCVRCQLSSQEPLKRRAPLGSFTDAWRASAPEAAISRTACESRSTRLETRTKESNR